jgi:uncharacterized protein YjdB
MKIWQNGKAVTYVVAAVDSLQFVENSYEWVDLGLPSGTLWATTNIGANSPEEFGYYFAWGETLTKQEYNLDNYQYYKDGGWTRYCPYGTGGQDFFDNLLTLLPEDDAATANWGSEWQTPDMNQVWELLSYEYTTKEWTQYNGVKGLLIKSNTNDKSIFLPVKQDDVNFGMYWTSSLDDQEPYQAFQLYFYKDEYISADSRDYRYNGHHIRPVRVEKGAPILVESIELSATTLILERGETAQLTATVLPADARQQAVLWGSNNYNVVNLDQTGKVKAVGPGTCVVTCSATDGSGVYAECNVTVYVDNSGRINGRDYVDLGLPSGTLWATMNVGANSPEEYGDYFAWGETTQKDYYEWETYKCCQGDYNTLTKYCYQSDYGYNGYTDTLTELLPEDDAATVNWDSNWQMPSFDQIKELCNSEYTTTEWTTQNGVNGLKITSKLNRNFIFLPAAGSWDQNSSWNGRQGDYWSRSIDTGMYSSFACELHFSSSVVGAYTTGRCIGFSVRPVRRAKNSAPVEQIVLSEMQATVWIGDTKQLTATVLPENATNEGVIWKSSNEKIATVDQTGLVKGIGRVSSSSGTTFYYIDSCTITCSAADGSGVKAECNVRVDAGASPL